MYLSPNMARVNHKAKREKKSLIDIISAIQWFQSHRKTNLNKWILDGKRHVIFAKFSTPTKTEYKDNIDGGSVKKKKV